MDEEEGVSSVTSVSEPSVAETLVENLGGEGQTDEVYNDEDGGEIMVEVVGSDVFVDGVCGDGEGDELGQDGSGKIDSLDEDRDFRSGEAGQEDYGNTGNGVEGVLEVAGSSRDVAVAAGTEIVPSVTACSVVEKVNLSDSEEDVEAKIVVRSTESAARADLASVDVAGLFRGVSETVDNESDSRLPSETADRVLEQVSTGVREEDAEGNVGRSTVSVEGSAELTSQRLDISDDGVWNPGIEPLAESSSFVPQDNPNRETEEANNLSLDSSEKDQSSVREIVGQASEKDISSHARDRMSDHPDEGAVSGDSDVLGKSHSEVVTMETNAHDQDRNALGDKDENTHSEVEPMETDVREQRDGLGNNDEDSHRDSELVQKKHSEAETMETDVHDKETVGLGIGDENSHPDVEPMETDVYDQEGGVLNKDENNNSNAVVELPEKINHEDDQIINMCHQVPAGHDNLGVDIPVSQDSASDRADEMVSLRPNSQILEDKGEEIKVGSGDSRISAEHTPVVHDHSLGINGTNVPLHPGNQEHSFKGNLAAENGVIGSSCEKANHAEDRELKVDNMHEDKNNFAVCTQAETSDMEIQTSNCKEVYLEGSEVSTCKVPISSDNGSLGGSDELPDVQPKVADGVSEVTHDDFLLPVQASAHDTGNLDEMEVEGVCPETTGTLTFSMNDESLNIVEVDARLENDARVGPLEAPYEPACRSDGASVEMDKDRNAQLGTTTARLSCTMGENILEDETRVSLETMISTRDMNTGDETNKVTHLLPESLDGDMLVQHVENESLLLFDNYAGKEGDPQMSAVPSNDDVMTEDPEGTSLACQDTSKTSDSNAVNVKSPSLLIESDFEVEAEHKVEAEDTALGEGPVQGDDLAHDTKNGAVTGLRSNITEESEFYVKQEGVVEHANMLASEMDLDAEKAATADKISNEENKSNLEDAIKSQAAINFGADVLPVRDQIVETCISDTSDTKMNQVDEDQDSFKATEDLVFHVHAPEIMKVTDEQEKGEVEKLYPGTVQESPEQDKGTEEVVSETSHTVMLNEKPVSLLNMHPGYLIPPENEGQYSISDLVWGKVRSHPWWPGQIFDPSDASEKAIKYHKKDGFLVAYFGDRTFAWNDASVLRPFCSHFSQIEKQSNSETFQNAISSALEEVSRRVELGLACSCTPGDSYDEISCQIVENTGIREESSKRYGVDKSTGVTSFVPDKLLHYMKALALSPTCRADRLDLTIARAQLVAFCRFKGYRLPPQFLLRGEFLENDTDIPHVESAIDDNGHASEGSEQHPTSKVSARKRKHSSKDSSQNKLKERSLSELMDNMECEYSPDGEDDLDEKSFTSSKKRKAVDSRTDGSDKKTSAYAAKVSTTASVSPKPSFRIGECIQRVASQLTRSASLLKGSSDQSGADVQSQDSPKSKAVIPTELPSANELLLQLQLVARAPLKSYNFLKTITTFFSGFRNSVAVGQNSMKQNLSAGRAAGGRKKRASQTVAGFAEEFEFDDVNDSYWTDRVVQNCGEEQPLQNSQSVTVQDPEKSNKPARRSYTRKRKSSVDHDMTPGAPPEDIEKRKHEPAELILIFAEGSPLPSEMNLNKMFRRFGPLKELETEVHQETSRARVVFKRGSDAEVAHSSVGKFNIFGSRQVTYELSYTPVISFKPMLLTITPGVEGGI
uniref:Putative ovule protein n=1 Tax=Solanum chacoense TaxID=4108 RepID=A0A0V0J158_SOLCH